MEKDIQHLSKQISMHYDIFIEMRKEIDKLKEFQAMFLSRLCDKHQEELNEKE